MGRVIFLLSVGLIAYGQSSPTITSVVDAYSGSATLCPGDIALITGTFLGTAPGVFIAGLRAYTLAPPLNGRHMTIQIPVDAPLGAVTVTLHLASGAMSNAFPITLTQLAPVLINSASGSVLSPVHRQSGLLVTTNYPAAPGETILISAIGLGPTNPAVATGTAAPVNAVTATAPSVTLGGNPVSGATAGLTPGQIGVYQVLFTVPASTSSGSYPVTLSIGGAAGNSLTLPVGPAPTGPVITSVLDAITASTALCPGDLAVLSGANLGANPQVTVGGKNAFVVTPPQNNQMTIEIPVDAPVGGANVVATSNTASSPPSSITLAAFAPVLYNSTSGSIISPAHQSTGAPVTSANPALPNETIVLYGIGLGATDPVVPTGTPAPPNAAVTSPVTIMLTGTTTLNTTTILLPGQEGVYQIAFTLPANTPTGNVFIQIQIGSVSSNYTTVPIVLTLAAPTIDHLSNNYSYIVPGLPNYGIAQGSIFDIFGTNLSNGATNLQHVPLQNVLQGATVSVTVASLTTQALLYFVTPNQIAAILPSSTPVGDGTITVDNGVNSASAPIHVVQSAFGILTLNQAGTGPASAFDLNFNQLGFTNALNPGDYFVLWGTGVGPVSGPENVTQSPADLTGVPFSIEVGGLPAELVYHGRSQYPGLDQVVGKVPAGVTPGCWVSVVTRSGAAGDIVSNFATLPVAASGRTCSDPNLGLTAPQMQALASSPSIRMGMVYLQKELDTQFAFAGHVTDTDALTASFLNVGIGDFASSVLGPSIGSCLVAPVPNNGGLLWGTIPATALDAGPSIAVSGPNGAASVLFQNRPNVYGQSAFGGALVPAGLIPFQNGAGAYSGPIDANNQLFIPADGGGQYSVNNGAGGANVGPFQTTLSIDDSWISWQQGSALELGNVSLAQGLTVTWTGGDNNSFVLISGYDLNANSASPALALFTCSVPATAGQFTIPSAVLLSLPSSGPFNFVVPNLVPLLQVAQLPFPQSFTVPNLDFAVIQAIFSVTVPVTYN